MDDYYPTHDLPATPEYVLAVLQDLVRIGPHSELDPDTQITFETTIAEWCPDGDARSIGRWQNQYWGIDCNMAEWDAIWPVNRRTLRDLCNLVARYVKQPVIRPAKIAGSICGPAGAFLTVRSMLRKAGATRDEIAPSAPLEPVLRRHCPLIAQLPRLAPGRLPAIRIRERFTVVTKCVVILGFLAFIVCLFNSATIAKTACLATCLLSFALVAISSKIPPRSVSIGELKTFRDLAELLAPIASGGEVRDNKSSSFTTGDA